MSRAGNPQQWRGVSGVPGLGLSVPFSLDTSGSVLNLWEEEKRPRNLWRSIKLWKGWGKERGGSCQQQDDGKPQVRNEQSGGSGQVEVSGGGQVVPGGQLGVQRGLASHSCRHGRLVGGKLKEANTQVGVATAAGGGHRPVRPLLSLPAYWHKQTGGGIRGCSVATQTSPQVASHKRLQRSSASSSALPIPPPTSSSDGLQAPSGRKPSSSRVVEPQTTSDIKSSQGSANLGSPMLELGRPSLNQTHSLLKRETSGQPTTATALRRLSSGQAQAVPPPLPPRLSLSRLANLPAGQPRMLPGQQRVGESHPRLARLSSSYQPPRILSQSSEHDGRGGEESSDLGGSLSSAGSFQGEVPFRARHDSLYSMGFSDICSPLTEVEPDYSTDNSDEDDDEEEEDEKAGVGHHDDGNIYEQVLNCRRSSLRLQLPPLPLSSLPAPPTRHPPPKTPITPSKTKQEVGGVKMWAGQGGEVIEEERKAGLRWKARQLKESLSAKFSLKLLQLSS